MKRNQTRVALFLYSLAGIGGAERMICQLADALVNKGLKVTLVTWDNPDQTSFYPIHPKVHWRKLGFRSGLFDKIRRVCMLTKFLKRDQSKILIGFVMSADKTVYAAAKIAGVKLVVAERNAPSMYNLRYGSLQRLMIFALMTLADKITVQFSRFVEGYPKILRSRIVSIHNPAPVPRKIADPCKINGTGEFILLSVSRLDNSQKKVDLLIRSFAKIANAFPAWKLTIIGDGPDKKMLLEQISRAGLNDRVKIMAGSHNLFDVYSKAHLFAITSIWEGFPNALAEAMSHGLPAVGFSDAPGVSDLIKVGGGGWLVDGVADELKFSRVLEQAMSDGKERLRRGALAIKTMKLYDSEASFNQWMSLIRSLE